MNAVLSIGAILAFASSLVLSSLRGKKSHNVVFLDMPILYVHGVNVRDTGAFDGIEAFLRAYVAPKLNPANPDAVRIASAFWGTDGVSFAWGGRARPRTAMLRKGAGEQATTQQRALMLAPFINGFPQQYQAPALTPGIQRRGVQLNADQVAAGTTVAQLTTEERADLVAIALASTLDESASRPIPIDRETALRIIAADRAIVSEDSTAESLASRVPIPATLAQGSDSFSALRDNLRESVDRVGGTPGFVLTRALEELRVPLNAVLTQFIGDVFVYLNARGGIDEVSKQRIKAGLIPRTVLTALRELQQASKGEATVVLSHSMGGQIVYDAVTHFLYADPEFADIRPIDVWCACASQVALFEEMKLLLMSDPAIKFPDRVVHPRHYGKLKVWLNVWDRNDILSFTAEPIFADLGPDDREFIGGASLINAHGSYLVRPSFYRMLAERIVS